MLYKGIIIEWHEKNPIKILKYFSSFFIELFNVELNLDAALSLPLFFMLLLVAFVYSESIFAIKDVYLFSNWAKEKYYENSQALKNIISKQTHSSVSLIPRFSSR